MLYSKISATLSAYGNSLTIVLLGSVENVWLDVTWNNWILAYISLHPRTCHALPHFPPVHSPHRAVHSFSSAFTRLLVCFSSDNHRSHSQTLIHDGKGYNARTLVQWCECHSCSPPTIAHNPCPSAKRL